MKKDFKKDCPKSSIVVTDKIKDENSVTKSFSDFNYTLNSLDYQENTSRSCLLRNPEMDAVYILYSLSRTSKKDKCGQDGLFPEFQQKEQSVFASSKELEYKTFMFPSFNHFECIEQG